MIPKQQSPLELLASFAVENAGGKFVRVERTTDAEYKHVTFVVFQSPGTHTELKLPIYEVSHDRIRKLIAACDEVPEVAAVLA